MLVQITRRHTGIRNVVRITKKREMPSTPKTKLKDENEYPLEFPINDSKNWKRAVPLSNSIHSKREIKKVRSEVFKAILLINWTFQLGTNNKIKTPKSGRNKIVEIKDILKNEFKKKSLLSWKSKMKF